MSLATYLVRADKLPHRMEGERVLLEHVPQDVRRVLDLSTGDGRLLAMPQAGHPEMHGVGLDFSEVMLNAARERFAEQERVELVRHDLSQSLPELGRFDAVISSFAIHHLEHARKRSLYGEVFDLLAPGGVFAKLRARGGANPPPAPRVLSSNRRADRERGPIRPTTRRAHSAPVAAHARLRWRFDDIDCYWKEDVPVGVELLWRPGCECSGADEGSGLLDCVSDGEWSDLCFDGERELGEVGVTDDPSELSLGLEHPGGGPA